MSLEKRKRPKETAQKSAMSRRSFLTHVLAAGAVASAGGLIARNKIPETVGEREVVREITFLDTEPHPRPYKMDSLAGKKFGEQFNRYFGFHEKTKQFSDIEHIDFKHTLAQLWRRKYERMRGDEPDEEYEMHHDGVLRSIEGVYRGYAAPEPGTGPTLDAYRRSIDGGLDHLEKAVRFPAIDRLFKLKPDQSRALQRFAGSLDTDLLFSYMLTELMPSENGTTNAQVFEFLLKNAGEGFIERIPALGDRKMSFGPYQFTDAAIKDVLGQKGKAIINGASIIDSTLERPVLPPNVESMRGHDHHNAAYLFGLYNLTHLVKELGEERCAAASKQSSFIDAAVRDYVIAAHHRPVDARQAFVRLLASRAQAGRAHSLADFCAKDVSIYVKKTHANSAALRAHIASR